MHLVTFLVCGCGLVVPGETYMSHGEVAGLLQHVPVDLEQHGLREGEVDGDVLFVYPAVLQCMHA